MDRVAVVGNLSLDLVDGGPPRVGGAPYYCGRALAALGVDALIATACAAEHRAALVEPLEALGIPVLWREADTTATFAIRNHGNVREMHVERKGPGWTPADIDGLALESVGWVHVAGLLRSDFPVETVAALATGRRLSLDAQSLVRAPRLGSLLQDGGFDRAILGHVSVLKVSEDEAPAVAGSADPGAFAGLGIPEVLLTLGTRGSVVIAGGDTVHVPALPPFVSDPTGAGDIFAAGYLAARAGGHEPVEAAREATALVARLLVVNATVSTGLGVFVVDLDDGTAIGPTDGPFEPDPQPSIGLPLVVATAGSGSTIVAVVDRRPRLVISNDLGRTWREAGGGLPAGRAIAISPDNPDVMLYAGASRLFVSRDGGRFWTALDVEFPEIDGVALG